MWSESDLIESFQRAGLEKGDLIHVHSSLRALGSVEGGADTVIDALLEVVGDEGTVSVPTHTFQVVSAKQPVFHQTLTPSNVGALTNVFRKRDKAVRGLHPTHSVAAIGSRAEGFVAGQEHDETPCSPTSPYGRLRDWGGKVLIIGVGLECCTFFHGCEQWADMPRAVSEEPVQLYSVTAGGDVIPIKLHTHAINTWDQYPQLEPHMLDIGALKVTTIGDCPLRVLDAARAADWLVARLKSDPSIILPDDTSDEE